MSTDDLDAQNAPKKNSAWKKLIGGLSGGNTSPEPLDISRTIGDDGQPKTLVVGFGSAADVIQNGQVVGKTNQGAELDQHQIQDQRNQSQN